MEWHVVTGEYPPQPGGVSDYTYQVCRELAKGGDEVHVWQPGIYRASHSEPVSVHALPEGFGWRWLKELGRGLADYPGPRNILIQYVPHMYGWKSMNLAFCWWIFNHRLDNIFVMFHEVAFPFRNRQPLRHKLLAVVHRAMAWTILRSVRHSFTSTEPYLALLRRLGKIQTPISMLRICSNIPLDSYRLDRALLGHEPDTQASFCVGIFSNFSSEICRTLAPVIGQILEDPQIAIRLLGPGEAFAQKLRSEYCDYADRISSTGRLHVTQVGEQMQTCHVLLQLYPDGASAARGTLIGAMASHVPVITNSGAATDTLLIDSKSMLFTDGTPRSVCGALGLLKSNPALARELASRAQAVYKESFDSVVIAAHLREVAWNRVNSLESAPEKQPVSSSVGSIPVYDPQPKP